MRLLSLLLIFTLLLACSEDETSAIAQQQPFIFEDGFEVENNDLNDLFPLDGSRWSTIQQNDPVGTTNEIDIYNNPVSEGIHSLRLLSNQSNEILSKIDIEKSGFQAFSENTVTIKADFYIASEESLPDLFLIDLECCSCWDPEVDMEPSSDGDNQCPGVRLKMSGSDGFLSIERGKIADTTIEQTKFPFPRNQWVTVEWTLTLSDQTDGINNLKINGNQVISSTGMNLPNAEVFRQVFAENDIDFSLQEPVYYERIQVGATANPSAGNVELFVDNFSLTIE